jgi:dihydrofolate reductase
MRKLIACINATLDGICDHNVIVPDDEIHLHYAELLQIADDILYGRITYQLMEFWPTVVANPTGIKATDDFAVTIDNINKIVFSHTLKELPWKNSRLAQKSLKEEVETLKQQPGRDILVGSPSLIMQALNLNVVDEFQLCVHPVIEGKGLQLFKNISERIDLNLIKTKTFKGGAIVLYYKPIRK